MGDVQQRASHHTQTSSVSEWVLRYFPGFTARSNLEIARGPKLNVGDVDYSHIDKVVLNLANLKLMWRPKRTW